MVNNRPLFTFVQTYFRERKVKVYNFNQLIFEIITSLPWLLCGKTKHFRDNESSLIGEKKYQSAPFAKYVLIIFYFLVLKSWQIL